MIQKDIITNLVISKLTDTRYFLVDITVSADNVIKVEIDAEDGVDIDFCVELNRFIEANFDREVEDYELEVGSAGLTSPFKVKRQYEKNLNKDVEVLEANGIKHEGVLVEVGDESFVIEETKMIRKEGDKRKKAYTERVEFKYSEIKYTKYIINFK